MVGKVIIAPLNWGLGHATRCIPIIRSLLDHNIEVVIASDGQALELLKKEFPQLRSFKLTSYNIRYRFGQPILNMLWHSLRFLYALRRENKEIDRIISVERPDLIISDNRYGVFSKLVSSVFVSHQISLQTGVSWINQLATILNKMLYSRFDHIWIPDYAPPNQIAPKLSSVPGKPFSYLGILSRLKPQDTSIRYDLCAVLSGPEPQRTFLEKILLDQMQQIQGNHIMVLGKTHESGETKLNNLTLVSHMTSERINQVFNESRVIVARSGYSTIMDMISMGKRAILIPTPGQPEQEYLSRALKDHPDFVIQEQRTLNLVAALKTMKDHQAIPAKMDQFDVMPFLEKLEIFSAEKDCKKSPDSL